jgi:hypothetical protein
VCAVAILVQHPALHTACCGSLAVLCSFHSPASLRRYHRWQIRCPARRRCRLIANSPIFCGRSARLRGTCGGRRIACRGRILMARTLRLLVRRDACRQCVGVRSDERDERTISTQKASSKSRRASKQLRTRIDQTYTLRIRIPTFREIVRSAQPYNAAAENYGIRVGVGAITARHRELQASRT